ncbi:unnamed protein product [Acanthoscelides obtectus]|uniref:Uncharacterized protein n=1 Tax=Acanthoscelides obtectus TaxID=200917 RepID=A0A9P0QG29_ACAOB|nr:unnamed protein product [Acanthoscelides obtectus]CAH2019431.1 unnamed protein product [Acanthoscelides obtectus]CAK1643559.1 hypothetical protein AOBTE_LOCUS13579 [Acanthoscelides obtectus]CAK1684980.1 hypothetical protein AOBTE_LOCUS35185 [Acanthoscelides obtectus]
MNNGNGMDISSRTAFIVKQGIAAYQATYPPETTKCNKIPAPNEDLNAEIGSQLNDLLLSSMIEAETCTTEKIPTDSDNFSDIRRYDLVYKINIVTLPITSLKKTSRWRP